MVAAQSTFLTTLLGSAPQRSTGMAWLDRVRAAALERANAAAVPSAREEEWRFTDLAPLARLSFQPRAQAAAPSTQAVAARLLPQAYARLVFVDGVFAEALSSLPSSAGVRVMALEQALRDEPALLEAQLARLGAYEHNVFTALNTAFLREAAVVVVDPGHAVSGPIHVLHLASGSAEPYAIYPRTLLVAGARSRCTLIEDFVALGEGAYFSAPLAEVSIAPDAAVSHIRLQREAASAFQIAAAFVEQARGSTYRLVHVALGARLSRLEVSVVHGATACETAIDGLAMIGARQLADTHTSVDHAHPEGRLRQTHRCVAGGAAHAVFNGKILVRDGAQRTDAAQSFRGLLLSERAQIDAKPQLEIFADDVKCAHGAAIGQLDAQALFYLRSRGLGEQQARNLLTYAFAAEVIERIAVPAVRSALARVVLERTREAA
ncbi:MAG: Fe-S cluster assembly protein SufD [Burkholderiales bacterium]|nr:Fe-S cluster assembly protein SufD [Burkholderiales bacterium]